jgi:hypothetical protein
LRRRDGDASKALLHLPLDLVVMSTSGNADDSSSSCAGGSVRGKPVMCTSAEQELSSGDEQVRR